MKRSRFWDEQIIAIVNEQETGTSSAEVCRRHDISGATFYKRKAECGGLEVSEAKRLRSLEDENTNLKRLLAEAMLDIAVLNDIPAKSGDARREAECGRPSVHKRCWHCRTAPTRRPRPTRLGKLCSRVQPTREV
jgi:putative transposase